MPHVLKKNRLPHAPSLQMYVYERDAKRKTPVRNCICASVTPRCRCQMSPRIQNQSISVSDRENQRRKNKVPDLQRKSRHREAILELTKTAPEDLIPNDLCPDQLSRNFLQHYRAFVDAGCHNQADAEPFLRGAVAERLSKRKGSGILNTSDLIRATQEWLIQLRQQRRSSRTPCPQQRHPIEGQGQTQAGARKQNDQSQRHLEGCRTQDQVDSEGDVSGIRDRIGDQQPHQDQDRHQNRRQGDEQGDMQIDEQGDDQSDKSDEQGDESDELGDEQGDHQEQSHNQEQGQNQEEGHIQEQGHQQVGRITEQSQELGAEVSKSVGLNLGIVGTTNNSLQHLGNHLRQIRDRTSHESQDNRPQRSAGAITSNEIRGLRTPQSGRTGSGGATRTHYASPTSHRAQYTSHSEHYQGASALLDLSTHSRNGHRRSMGDLFNDDDQNYEDSPAPKRQRLSLLLHQDKDLGRLSNEGLAHVLATDLQSLNALPSGTFLDRAHAAREEADAIDEDILIVNEELSAASVSVDTARAAVSAAEQDLPQLELDQAETQHALQHLSSRSSASLASKFRAAHDEAVIAYREADATTTKLKEDLVKRETALETMRSKHRDLKRRSEHLRALVKAYMAYEQARDASVKAVSLATSNYGWRRA